MHKVRVEDRKEVCEDFKTIHQAKDAEATKIALEAFCEKWRKSYKKSHARLTGKPVFTNVLRLSQGDLAKHLLDEFNRVVQ